MNIFEKLLNVQSELNAPKGQWNAFSKFKYRSCEDILEAVKPLLKKVKASLIVRDELVQIGDRFYVKATAEFYDVESENSGEKLSTSAYAREELTKKGMDSSQITGSASSYARKYALNGLFCIDDNQDADSKDNTEKLGKSEKEMQAKQKEIEKQTIGQAKINVIKKELERTGINEGPILKRYKIQKMEDITEELFPKVVSALKKTPSKEVK